MDKQVFYQPILTAEEFSAADLPSFCVYRSFKNCKDDFPGKRIGAYTEDDIQEHLTFVDDEDDRTPTYCVDVPNPEGSDWINIDSFKTREQALELAREQFGADENGMVSLISRVV